MNEDEFSGAIRAALIAREPGPVSVALHTRVAAIPAITAQRRRPGSIAILRGGAQVVALAASVAVVLAVAAYGIDRRASGGAPPDPTFERVPFVVDGAGLFSASAVKDADQRLEALFRSTGLEATLVTQREAAPNQLSTPDGFPERYDRDGNGDRDIVQVVALDPQGTLSCCLSISGPIVARAISDYAWPPQTRVPNLTAAFSSAAVAERDAALGQFVKGVALMSDRLDAIAESVRTTEAIRTGAIGGLIAAIAACLFWLVGWRPLRGLRRRVALDSHIGGAGPFEELSTFVPAESGAALPPRPAARPMARGDALLLLGALAALGAFVVQGLAYSPAHLEPRPVDLSAVGFGVAAAAVTPALVAGLPAASLLLLGVLAARVGRVGWAILCLVLVAIASFGVVAANEEPALGAGSTTGMGFRQRESTGIEGTTKFDSYPVANGVTFTFAMTIRNPGPLPMTIAGLAETFTKPGPGFVPGLEVVGMGTRSDDVLSGSAVGADVFQPVRLTEGEEVQVVVVGRGGTCAAGSDRAESVALLTRLPIAYSVLGVSRVVEIGLPSVVSVPTLVASCKP